jgi:tripeptide aminopeptidase
VPAPGKQSLLRAEAAPLPKIERAVSVVALFTELVSIPSPSGDERLVADRLIRELRQLGLQVDEDESGRETGASAGNLLCRLEPTAPGEPLFFCAHLDTVPPSGPIEPVEEDGVIRNGAGTILGADNKASIAAMVEAVRRLAKEDRPHAGVELLFTPMEEIGLLGAAAFDHTRLRARVGYVYDQAAPIGEVIVGAPSAYSIDLRFRGRAAHAGMYPEEGRSAIAAAARAVADLRLGRIDDETTANVGLIEGGTAVNVVPEWCTVRAEARAHDERKLAELVEEMLETCSFAATGVDCELEATVEPSYRAYRFRREDTPVRLAAAALRSCGFEPSYALSGGAADANVFNERGLACANLGNGMTDIHTPAERIALADLEAMVDVTLALIAEARS